MFNGCVVDGELNKSSKAKPCSICAFDGSKDDYLHSINFNLYLMKKLYFSLDINLHQQTKTM